MNANLLALATIGCTSLLVLAASCSDDESAASPAPTSATSSSTGSGGMGGSGGTASGGASSGGTGGTATGGAGGAGGMGGGTAPGLCEPGAGGGGGQGGIGGAGGQGGVGGSINLCSCAPDCSCSEFIANPACTQCDSLATPSEVVLQALSDCQCVDQCAGPCSSACTGGTPNGGCINCLAQNCSTEQTACAND